MDVALAGQAGADGQELADPGLAGQVPDHPAQERPVGLGAGRSVGHYLQREVHDSPVRGEVVLAIEEGVIDPGDVRLRDVDAGWNRLPSAHADSLPPSALRC